MAKTNTDILVTKSGKTVHTAYPWDSKKNRAWNKQRLEKIHGPLEWKKGPTVDTINGI